MRATFSSMCAAIGLLALGATAHAESMKQPDQAGPVTVTVTVSSPSEAKPDVRVVRDEGGPATRPGPDNSAAAKVEEAPAVGTTAAPSAVARDAAARIRDSRARGFRATMDLDGDGRVSRAEFTSSQIERAQKHFAMIDRDGDGFLTPDDSSVVGRRNHFVGGR